jgi:hypothetical protein
LGLAAPSAETHTHTTTYTIPFVENTERMLMMTLLNTLLEFFDLRGWLLVCLVFIPLERLLALHKEQHVFRKWWWDDRALGAAAVCAGLLRRGDRHLLGHLLLALVAAARERAPELRPAALADRLAGVSSRPTT